MARGRVELGDITFGPTDETDLEREERLAQNPVWSRRIQQAEQNLQERGVSGGPDVTWTRREPAPEPDSFDENAFLRGLSTIGRQVAQGASFDFADEIAGGVVSALPESARGYLAEQFAPDDATPNEREAYRQAGRDLTYRDVQQAGQAQSERDREERPIVSLASNVAGGLMAGRAAGPMVGNSARAAGSAVERVAPALARPLRTAASAVRGNAAGRVATNLTGVTALGAGYGALGGAGASRGNLDTEEGRERMQEDISSGATAGAILGGGLGITGEALRVATPYVRGRISGLRGADIPENMAQELMAVPENPSMLERVQLTASPATVQRRLNETGGRVQRELIDATSDTAILPRASQEIASIAREGIENLPTGIQPRLRRVLRNIETEAKRYSGWNAWNNQPVRGLNSMIDELGMLAEQGSRDAAVIRQRIIDATRRGASDVVGEAQRHIRGIQNDPRGMNNVRSRIVGQLESIVENSMNIQDKQKLMENIDIALAALRQNVERQGGRTNPIAVQQLISRYANYTISGIPLSVADVQRVVPALNKMYTSLIGPLVTSPTINVATNRFVSEVPVEDPIAQDEMADETESLSPEEIELQEIQAELERRRELEEIQAELERRRNSGRSLRSQRRRERNRR